MYSSVFMWIFTVNGCQDRCRSHPKKNKQRGWEVVVLLCSFIKLDAYMSTSLHKPISCGGVNTDCAQRTVFPSALTCSNWPEKRKTLLLILWQIGCGSNFMTKCISLIRLLRKVTQGNLIKSGEEWLNCWTLIMKTPPWTNSFFFFLLIYFFATSWDVRIKSCILFWACLKMTLL